VLKTTDDLRLSDLREIRTPAEVIQEFPRTDVATRTVLTARHALHNILHGRDDRLAAVIGPCSIHDRVAALDYARRLAALRHELAGSLAASSST
jgi:3-deoxy-7-phosphoheptulonate synthase